MTGVNIDVTERKQTEALLSESKARLADAMAAGQVMAFEWDAVTGQSRRSDNAGHILGIEQAAWPVCRATISSGTSIPTTASSLKTHIRELSLAILRMP